MRLSSGGGFGLVSVRGVGGVAGVRGVGGVAGGVCERGSGLGAGLGSGHVCGLGVGLGSGYVCEPGSGLGSGYVSRRVSVSAGAVSGRTRGRISAQGFARTLAAAALAALLVACGGGQGAGESASAHAGAGAGAGAGGGGGGSAGSASPPPAAAQSPAVTGGKTPHPLARSVPVGLRIPAIGVDTPVMGLGLEPDGTVQVPPVKAHDRAGWYRHSPTPGQVGPSVILGHVTVGVHGDGVFRHLARLHRGDRITARLENGSEATFTVTAVRTVAKAHFPTDAVYGDVNRPELRLITCGGPRIGDGYADNVIVFAALTSTTPPR